MTGVAGNIPPLRHEVIRDEVLPFLHQPGISSIYGYSRWSLVNAQLWWYDIPSSRRNSLTARENALERAYYSGKFLEMTPRLKAYYTQHEAAVKPVGKRNKRRAAKLQHRQHLHTDDLVKELKRQEETLRLTDKENRLRDEARRQCEERGWLVNERARLAQEERRLSRWSDQLGKIEERLNQIRETVALIHPEAERVVFGPDEEGKVQLVDDMEGLTFNFNNYRTDQPNPFGNSMQ